MINKCVQYVNKSNFKNEVFKSYSICMIYAKYNKMCIFDEIYKTYWKYVYRSMISL
jgi:hypothetical protein